MAGQGFVKNHTQGEDVSSRVRNPFQQHFRRHVGGRSAHAASAIDGGALVATRQVFGHTKVENLHSAIGGQHDIFRLDVAMDDAALVRSHESLGAFLGDSEELLEGHGIA